MSCYELANIICLYASLSKVSDSKDISVKVVHDTELPFAGLRVHDHLIHDCLLGSKLFHVHIDLYWFLFVVAHRLEFYCELSWALLSSRQCELVWLLKLATRLRREGSHTILKSTNLNRLEQVERLSSLINTSDLNFGSLLNERYLEALLDLPSWDLVAKLLHQKLHDVVALGMDHKSGQVIKWSLLQVANNEATTVLSTSCRHAIGGRHSET